MHACLLLLKTLSTRCLQHQAPSIHPLLFEAPCSLLTLQELRHRGADDAAACPAAAHRAGEGADAHQAGGGGGREGEGAEAGARERPGGSACHMLVHSLPTAAMPFTCSYGTRRQARVLVEHVNTWPPVQRRRWRWPRRSCLASSSPTPPATAARAARPPAARGATAGARRGAQGARRGSCRWQVRARIPQLRWIQPVVASSCQKVLASAGVAIACYVLNNHHTVLLVSQQRRRAASGPPPA